MSDPTRTVTLSTGEEIQVGRLRWKGYKRIRDLLVVEALPGLLEAVQPLLAAPALSRLLNDVFTFGGTPSFDATAIGDAIESLLANKLPALVSRAAGWSDQLTELLIEHSSSPAPDADGLLPADVGALRAAALEVNDLASLVALEKNWLSALGTTGRKLLGLDQSSSPDGPSDGNPSSSAPTDGNLPTSTN